MTRRQGTVRGRRSAAAALCGALLLAASAFSCASDEAGPPAAANPNECEVCSPGSVQCIGSYSVTCAADGRSMSALPCADDQFCEVTSGTCKSSECPSPGYRACNGSKLDKCKAGVVVSESCPTGEACVGGACVKTTCTDGETACGFGAVLECAGGGYTVKTQCAAGERCKVEAGAAGCAKQICTPGAALCADQDKDGVFELAHVCNDEGSGPVPELAQDCKAKGGACEAGLCKCGVPVGGVDTDATSGDTIAEVDAGPTGGDVDSGTSDDAIVINLDVPQLEPLDKGKATINGEEIVFDGVPVGWIPASADEGSEGLGILQIQMSAGLRIIELQVGPVPPDWSGSINTSAGGDVAGFIGYNDGTAPPEVDFTYGAGVSSKGGDYAGSWDITIDTNGGHGGRVSGSFYGTLNNYQGAGELEMKDGIFDIKYP